MSDQGHERPDLAKLHSQQDPTDSTGQETTRLSGGTSHSARNESLAGTQPPTAPTFHQHGPNGVQAYKYSVHLNGDYVHPVPIEADAPVYRASEYGRFVEPREPRQLSFAAKLLEEHGIVVLCAPSGTGRQTAAVRLLRHAAPQEPSLFDLEPEWSKPTARCLPVDKATGYVLDLSDLPDEPGSRFGQELARHGTALRDQQSFLVVLATPGDWQGDWADSTLAFTVQLESPDARALVEAELEAVGHTDRVAWLKENELSDIWTANPSAREACRLAGLLGAATGREQLKDTVDRFGDWHTTVEKLLDKRGSTDNGDPSLLSTRVTVWAGALLDGGQRASVIRASDALLAKLGVTRGPADVLADATSSRRLKAAKIKPDGDRAYHDQNCQGLPSAILRHLWDEFPTQHDLLTKWAVGVASDRAIPDDDARLVTEALLRLAVRRHDRAVLDALSTGLARSRRVLAVEALTKAAEDAELSRYVRDRLRNWADSNTLEKTDLVIDVCRGPWGREQPSLALTRLGKAAGAKPFGCANLVDAFQKLAHWDPGIVHKSVLQWLQNHGTEADGKPRRQALGSFLALVSGDVGTDLVLAASQDALTRERFVHAWQSLLSTDDAVEATLAQLMSWQERFEEDLGHRDAVMAVFAEIFTPPRLRLRLDRLLVTEQAVVRPFWREILGQAVHRYNLVQKASEG